MPTLSSQEDADGGYTPIKSVKESDILLLSTEDLLADPQINRKKATDVKKILNPTWLKSNLMKPWVMLAYVNEKTKKGTAFLEIQLDRGKSQFLKSESEKSKDGYVRLFVYVIESLSTNIREYKTLRMCEFFGLADTILEPKKSLMKVVEGD